MSAVERTGMRLSSPAVGGSDDAEAALVTRARP